MKLLTRDEFREGTFARDNQKCVVCGAEGKLDAHHIIERRLWSDGGYYLNNGASLCEPCHKKAESTEFSCEFIREKAGIPKIILPDGWYYDTEYTKWGDVILPNGKRMKGPLFDDESVQKILATGPHLGDYTDYVKYPRTWHLPWSQGKTKDDRTIPDCSQFVGKEVVITEKLDGENTSIYPDYIHARSIDGRNHWPRDWVKNLQAQVGWQLDKGWRLCGENLYAKHSIKYADLESFFFVFSIWNEKNVCLSWDETAEYSAVLGLQTVPVLYRGVWDEKIAQSLWNESKRERMEGYVVRTADGFPYKDFTKSMAKFVRANHVNQNSHHWFSSAIERNELKK